MRTRLLLDGFCGEGGVGEGFARAGFRVVGVDNDPDRLEHYPYEAHQGDALAFIVKYGRFFDFVHISPTCTGYSRGTAAIPDRFDRYDRLIDVGRAACQDTGRPYTIENVYDARRELVDPILYCGRMFGLTAVDTDGTVLTLDRHRLFESSIPVTAPPHTPHGWKSNRRDGIQVAGVYGGARRDKHEARHVRKGGYVPADLDVQRTLIGAPWMTERGAWHAIPPAYTEHLGRQLLAALNGAS